ncbi:hypothetical protein ACI2IY_02505 [Lysobacter enzymogenes]|uniref:hypothetical protein n=1 Tax=Lysobacter enzymogenes TaxID=69 RepID=UPI00385096DD
MTICICAWVPPATSNDAANAATRSEFFIAVFPLNAHPRRGRAGSLARRAALADTPRAIPPRAMLQDDDTEYRESP